MTGVPGFDGFDDEYPDNPNRVRRADLGGLRADVENGKEDFCMLDSPEGGRWVWAAVEDATNPEEETTA